LGSFTVYFHFMNSGTIRNVGVVPDDEELSAFLHRYRPIILKKEPTEFTNVCSRLIRHINHPPFTRLVEAWKEQYSGKTLRQLCSMQQGDINLIGQAFLDTYLNAFEFHRNKGYRARLSAFAQTFEPEARRGLVTLLLTLKFCAVSSLRQMICELQRLKLEHEASNKASVARSEARPGAES